MTLFDASVFAFAARQAKVALDHLNQSIDEFAVIFHQVPPSQRALRGFVSAHSVDAELLCTAGTKRQ